MHICGRLHQPKKNSHIMLNEIVIKAFGFQSRRMEIWNMDGMEWNSLDRTGSS
uniref:Uncharacterized protein n=1 Tax=Anguilla anguilla TaxID=7936 RepID=A0A0E9SGP4_ANGAN